MNTSKQGQKEQFKVGDTVSYIAWEGTLCERKITVIHEEIKMATLSKGEMICFEKLTLLPPKPIDCWSMK